jgi:hypothetical protein
MPTVGLKECATRDAGWSAGYGVEIAADGVAVE